MINWMTLIDKGSTLMKYVGDIAVVYSCVRLSLDEECPKVVDGWM